MKKSIKKENSATAFKAFDKNFKCRGYQFEIGKSYEHPDEIEICSSGFHSCSYPLDVWNYYDMLESKYAIVGASGNQQTHKDDSKICSSKLHVKAELTLPQFIKASIDWHFEGWFKKAKKDGVSAASKPKSKLAATGNYSNLAATGNYSNLAATGDDSKLAATGYGSKLAATGNGSNVIVSAERDIIVKAALNTLICLTHYVDGKPQKFVTGQIGKKNLLPDTWYKLNEEGKFIEHKE